VPQGEGAVSGMVFCILRNFSSIDLNGDDDVLIMVLIDDRLVVKS